MVWFLAAAEASVSALDVEIDRVQLNACLGGVEDVAGDEAARGLAELEAVSRLDEAVHIDLGLVEHGPTGVVLRRPSSAVVCLPRRRRSGRRFVQHQRLLIQLIKVSRRRRAVRGRLATSQTCSGQYS